MLQLADPPVCDRGRCRENLAREGHLDAEIARGLGKFASLVRMHAATCQRNSSNMRQFRSTHAPPLPPLTTASDAEAAATSITSTATLRTAYG